MPSIVSQKMSRGQGNEFLNKLEGAGLLPHEVQPVIDSPDNQRAKEIVAFIRGGYEESESQQRARAIMGRNSFGIATVSRHFGVIFTPEELEQLGDIPFSDKVLEQCKDTHVLFPGYALNLLEVRDIARNANRGRIFFDQDWYETEKFATEERVNLHWYLMRKKEVEYSTSKTWDLQRTFLPKHEFVPRACERVYLMVLYYLEYGERILPYMEVRCSDNDSSGDRVGISLFDLSGFQVVRNWDYSCWSGGLSASRYPS